MRGDVFEILGAEAAPMIDSLGYEFLESQGYEAKKARKYSDEREKLRKRLKKDRAELRYYTMVDREDGAILFWYAFFKKGRKVAVSKAIKFKPAEDAEKEEQ